jgi:hypothetical protein
MQTLRSTGSANKVCMRALAILLLVPPFPAHAQSRGVYPLGMSSTNSGITPPSGFTYSNQLLFYYRNESKDQNGATKPVTGSNAVVMDMNSIIWVSTRAFLGGAHYSAIATLPFAKNDLTSDINGNISGGGGFADSYYVPFILGWNKEHISLRLLYGFLAPTGRYASDASNNVGSGYWTNAISSGQTFSLTRSKTWALSTFEMYEFHTTQEGTQTHPGQTFDLDYSLVRNFTFPKSPLRLQLGVTGYEARQTTGHSGPAITPALAADRYAINSIGVASQFTFPRQRLNLGMKFFEEFADRSTFQGYSLQFTGVFNF